MRGGRGMLLFDMKKGEEDARWKRDGRDVGVDREGLVGVLIVVGDRRPPWARAIAMSMTELALTVGWRLGLAVALVGPAMAVTSSHVGWIIVLGLARLMSLSLLIKCLSH
jgi:hypothetical protein